MEARQSAESHLPWRSPKAGWKGRGLYANYGTNFLWHIEGGKGTKSKLMKFQVRPDPLAK